VLVGLGPVLSKRPFFAITQLKEPHLIQSKVLKRYIHALLRGCKYTLTGNLVVTNTSMRDQSNELSENWVEITFRRLKDRSLNVRSANIRRQHYTNRITFKGGLQLNDVLRAPLGAEILCSMLASQEGNDYQQFMVRLNKVDGHMYSIFAEGLIQEDRNTGLHSPETIVELVRQKIVEPVNKLSTVFEGYDKDTTFAIIPAYFNVLKRLMNTRLQKLEATLRGPKTLQLEHKTDTLDEYEASLNEPKKKISNGS